ALIVGFLIGFFTSVPIGPINLAIMMKGLSNRTGQGLMIGAGTGLMDIVYCGAAMFGISALITNPKIALTLQIATFLIFLGFAVKTTFFKIPEAKLKQDEDAPGFKRYFLLGIVLYFSNPSFIAYWITVAGIMHSYRVIQPTVSDDLLFAVGTGLGTFTWFFVLLELVEKYKVRLSSDQIQNITRAFGAILLIITAVMGWNLLNTLMK
ncbi:MAG TPA: LysE family transporter, partial [Bacteroidota bacterium]|nr:LysE family transporter [Bacteroidota bacterium]